MPVAVLLAVAMVAGALLWLWGERRAVGGRASVEDLPCKESESDEGTDKDEDEGGVGDGQGADAGVDQGAGDDKGAPAEQARNAGTLDVPGSSGHMGAYETDQPLQESASELLVRYRDRGDCVLCRAGYADLAGNVWSCVIQGLGWVDLCVVVQEDGDAGSSVSTLRLKVSEWEEEFDAQG